MRLTAVMQNQYQVGGLVDTLKNNDFDRQDMIISNLAEQQLFNHSEDAAEETILVKRERDALGEPATFASGIEGLQDGEGIIVTVECSKHMAGRVREIMIQSGALRIIED